MSFPKPTKRLKYGNKKTNFSGYAFDSKLESAVYQLLQLQVKTGDLIDFKVKPNVHLTDARILMIPDFCATEKHTGILCFYEAKGAETPVWRIKLKLWKIYGFGPLYIFKGNYRKPVLAEVVIPKSRKTGMPINSNEV